MTSFLDRLANAVVGEEDDQVCPRISFHIYLLLTACSIDIKSCTFRGVRPIPRPWRPLSLEPSLFLAHPPPLSLSTRSCVLRFVAQGCPDLQ